MRHQSLFVATTVALTLGLGGCGIFNRFSGGDPGAVGDQPADAPPAEIQPVEAPPADGTPIQGTAPDGTPVEGAAPAPLGDPTAEAPLPVGSVPLDLIASTDPEARAQQVMRDRPDPFAVLPTTPTVEIPVEEAAASPNAPGSPNAANPGAVNGPGGAPPGTLAPVPDLVPGQQAEPLPPPPPPQPEIARAVEVTGVVQIGSVPYAILQAPNEPHSRYVRAGQRLSNGQVLVKRIEMGVEPVVILEQFGIEVVRNIGAESEPDAAPETTAQGTPSRPVS
ncbi:MAG: hypothetical protein VKK04_20460 [Synechococcales bacterium]|nr:hypothetical protein [Synechococcales bacterium]